MNPFTSLVTALLLLLTQGALANKAPKPSSWGVTKQYCTTKYGSRSVKHVPTTTKTITKTQHPRVTITSTPSTTFTPAPSTTTVISTISSTITSTVSSTDTFSTTTTISTDTTVTADTTFVTETSTTTTTTTTTASTTVASTQGFVPIQSSVQGASYNGLGGGPQKRSEEDVNETQNEPRANSQSSNITPFSFGQKGRYSLASKQQCRSFPQCVDCTKTITSYCPEGTKTVTASRTKTITAPQKTTTVTSSTTTTLTETTVVSASTTTTFTTSTTSTSTVTPTGTTTTTTTATATMVATATAYAICQDRSNYADTLDGQQGVQINEPSGDNNFMVVSGGSNALDCCNQCASDSNCGVSSYDAQDGNCYISETCGIDWRMFNLNVPFVFMNGCNTVRRQ